MSFGERLREERKRLELSQTEFGERCDVKQQAQLKYESGGRQPKSDYLQKASDMGVDINYLFTGKRSQPVELPSDEAFLLDSFRSLNAEQKKMALQFLMGGFGGLQGGETGTVHNNSVVNSHNGNVVHNNGTVNSHNTGVVNSPNTVVSNSFNSQGGFTELPFLLSSIICGMASWVFGMIANFKVATDVLASMTCGGIGTVALLLAVVFTIFARYAREHKYKNKRRKT